MWGAVKFSILLVAVLASAFFVAYVYFPGTWLLKIPGFENANPTLLAIEEKLRRNRRAVGFNLEDIPASRINQTSDFRIEEDFSYTDTSGQKWLVPAGYDRWNGASVPQFLWSTGLSPYGKLYDKATVIHDYFCEPQNRENFTSEQVHLVFYEAMRANQTPRRLARAMYFAVANFGPQWGVDRSQATSHYTLSCSAGFEVKEECNDDGICEEVRRATNSCDDRPLRRPSSETCIPITESKFDEVQARAVVQRLTAGLISTSEAEIMLEEAKKSTSKYEQCVTWFSDGTTETVNRAHE